MSKRYRGISDAQANAEALARRAAPYAVRHTASVTVAWDYRKRQPANIREAVHYVRKAYADEIPAKLHESYGSIGEGGTPKMTARAEGYLFGHPQASDAKRDAETGDRELVSYFHAPFRATLDRLAHGNEADRRRAAIVSHITIGQQGPIEAAVAEGVPAWCAHEVAERALSVFLANLSDMRIDDRHVEQAESVTAA